MRLLLLLCVLLCFSGCARPPAAPPPAFPPPALWQNLPPVTGYLLEDATWRGEVLMAGDILVPAGKTLTIDSGTTIYVTPTESTKIDPEWLSPDTELLVRGSLVIAGTAERPVRFLPTSLPEGAETAWAGIILDRTEAFRLAGVELALAESGILAIGASGVVENSTISRCRYGIVLQGDAAPVIRGNRVQDGEGGIFCWWGAHPRLLDNLIRNNEEEGLFIDGRSRPLLAGNRIVGNGIGIAAFNREFRGDEAQLADNTENLRPLAAPGVLP